MECELESRTALEREWQRYWRQASVDGLLRSFLEEDGEVSGGKSVTGGLFVRCCPLGCEERETPTCWRM